MNAPSSNASSSIQNALLRVLKALTPLPAQVVFYGAAAFAVAATTGYELPGVLGAVVAAVGANSLSSILERVARGDEPSDEEIRQTVQKVIQESNIEKAATSNEFQRAIAHVFRQFDLVKYAVEKGEYNIVSLLTDQFSRHQEFMKELQGELSIVKGQLDTLSTREQSDEIMRVVQQIANQLEIIIPAIPNRNRTVRIFIASPSDVDEERKRIQNIISEFNEPGAQAEQYNINFHILGWEKAVSGMGNAQGVILNQMPVNQWDIFIGILWKHFGSPTGNIDPISGLPFNSGTEEEFTLAYRSWRESGRPYILFYRKGTPPASMDDIDVDQLSKVKLFLEKFKVADGHPGLFTTYPDVIEFERRVRQDIVKLLPRIANSSAISIANKTRANIEKTITAPLSNPWLSYEEVDYCLPPQNELAYELSNSKPKNLEVKLSPIWGLERGSFIGISGRVSGPDNYLINTLRYTEYFLFKEIKNGERELSKRLWIEADYRSLPNGPDDLRHIWNKSTINPNDQIVRNLQQYGLPDNHLIGIIFSLKETKDAATELRTIANWVNKLINYKSQNIAMILDIKTNRYSSVTALTKQAYQILSGITPLPIDVVVSKDAPDHVLAITNPSIVDFIGNEGLALYQWITCVIEGEVLRLEDSTTLSFKHVLEVYKNLTIKFRHVNRQDKSFPSASSVISNLDAIGSVVNTDKELLELTYLYRPDMINHLLSAYINSKRSSAITTSLLFSAQSDALLDCWITSSEMRKDIFPSIHVLSADAVTGKSIINKIALAVSRYYTRTHDIEAKNLLQKWKGVLSKDVSISIDMSTGSKELNITDIEDLNAKQLLMIFKSGVDTRKIDIWDKVNFLDAETWWYLASLPAHLMPIKKIILLSADLRLVFGLINDQERTQAYNDPAIMQRILECRMQRKLPHNINERSGQ